MSLNSPYPTRPAGGHLFKFYALPLRHPDARSLHDLSTKVREITLALSKAQKDRVGSEMPLISFVMYDFFVLRKQLAR